MRDEVKILDTVALLRPIVSDEGAPLRRGQVGAAVEELGGDHFLVEFADESGEAYAFASVAAGDLIVLHEQPIAESSAE